MVSSDYWWILADRDTVYDITFGNPDIDTVDFVIASGNGSGEPGTPVGLNSRYQDSEFQVLYDHLNTAAHRSWAFRCPTVPMDLEPTS